MIDWTKPLEHVDGTPLVFSAIEQQPDDIGDYVLVREDGEPFTRYQISTPSWLIVGGDGRYWRDRDGPVLVRNRDEPVEEKALSEDDGVDELALVKWRLENMEQALASERSFHERHLHDSYERAQEQALEIENLRAQIERLTATMTVAQLREAGFEVEIHG